MQALREFIKLESFASILLGIAAIVGLILENSPAKFFYENLLYQKNFFLFINDGLMVLFFLMVGLEIKREILIGELNTSKKILLPAVAAFAGMIFPAVIYLLFNGHNNTLLKGWAIPTATDIAFALGVLNLAGKHIPLSLKVFLTALAIFDDLGAVIIIALFYTPALQWIYLIAAGSIFLLLFLLHHFSIKSWLPYILAGFLLWLFILKSGIHPTVAGVLFAFMLPKEKLSLENLLHPWAAYLILPLFALANTGIPLQEFTFSFLFSSLSLGIILGLLLGKSLGIFIAVWLSAKSHLAVLPAHCNFKMIGGTTLLCGIGFTMSFFISNLAFEHSALINTSRAAILTGSVISGLCGYFMLRRL